MPYKIWAIRLVALLQNVYLRCYKWLGSPRFFYIVLSILILQSLWIALTARYPQAFDENFHFGLIRLHAEQWLPFFSSHPPGAEIYGAVSRDPSYLYHYVLSIPYRLLELITTSITAQVISLRLINIACFVGGIFVYRKVLAELGISRRLMHVVLLFFVLTPIVPLLAGQINYDNLIFLLTGMLFLCVVRYWKSLHIHNTVSIQYLLFCVLLILLTSIIKYTSTPLSIALITITLGLTVWRYKQNKQLHIAWPSKLAVVSCSVFIAILGLLAFERYGINMIRYQHVVPDCSQVLTVEQCKSYSPWARDYFYEQNYPKPTNWGIFVYPGVWVHRMVFETMFTITSRFTPSGKVEYWPVPPLTVANYTAWTILVAGACLVIFFWRKVWHMMHLRWLLIAIVFYTVILFVKNFSMYLHTGEAMAIHGRYLIPVYPILYVTIALSFGWFFERLKRPQFKVWLTILTILFLIHGAGIIVWLIRSDAGWYWQHIPWVQDFNILVRDALRYVIIP